MKTGIELIAEERQRQMSVEGWTEEHDDKHTGSELVDAALCYAAPSYANGRDLPEFWPWASHWWNPSSNKIRNLQKAGALIAAEIDRLQRIEQQKGEQR